MTTEQLRAGLQLHIDNPNVKAFLHLIRVGEGTADEDGWRRHFGGELFDSFAEHPAKPITKSLGGKPITSTAAGAFQFLYRTWIECQQLLGLPDFSPHSQTLAALFLIRRCGALQDVLDGRIEEAIAKCAGIWASLPGATYGQPTKSMDQALEAYRVAGGVMRPADTPAPVETREIPKENTMPVPLIPILAAVLPTLIDSIPKLGKLFGSGSEVQQRNVAAAELAVKVVQEAVGATNAQEAAEIVSSDPEKAQVARHAIDAAWGRLDEAGGGGIEGARKHNDALAESGTNALASPAFVISLALLIMPMLLLVDVFFIHPGNYPNDMRTQIITGVLMIIGIVGGYWLGSSFGSSRKTDLIASK